MTKKKYLFLAEYIISSLLSQC